MARVPEASGVPPNAAPDVAANTDAASLGGFDIEGAGGFEVDMGDAAPGASEHAPSEVRNAHSGLHQQLLGGSPSTSRGDAPPGN